MDRLVLFVLFSFIDEFAERHSCGLSAFIFSW